MKVTADQYGEICDVIEREVLATASPGFGPADGYLHTSPQARAAANRIIEILGLDIEDPREISR